MKYNGFLTSLGLGASGTAVGVVTGVGVAATVEAGVVTVGAALTGLSAGGALIAGTGGLAAIGLVGYGIYRYFKGDFAAGKSKWKS